MKPRASPLKWMRKTMRSGEWSIWGTLAGQQLARTSSPEINLHGTQDLGEALERLEETSGRVCCSSYNVLLRLCGETKAPLETRRVHSHIIKSGLEGDTFVGNLLVETYGKLGLVSEARAAFDKIREPNHFSLNLLIAVYCKHGLLEQAEAVLQTGDVDVVGWNTLLSAYAKFGYLDRMDSMLLRMPGKNVVSWNTVVTIQSELNLPSECKKTFDCMPEHDLVSWNVLLQACPQNADQIFEMMPERNVVSWMNMLVALSQCHSVDDDDPEANNKLRLVYDLMPHWNAGASTVMMQVLGQNGQLPAAWSLFVSIPDKQLDSWNAIMSASAQPGQLSTVRQCFAAIPALDVVSWNTMLTTLCSNSRLQEAKRMFTDMPQRDPVSWNIMLQAHTRSSDALPFFQRAPQTSMLAWNWMIAALMHSGDAEEARWMFDNAVPGQRSLTSWTWLLQGYIGNGSMEEAEELMAAMPCMDCVVWGIVICGYARSGLITEAMEVLDRMPDSDVVAWNTVLQALAELKSCSEAKELFDAMPRKGLVSWSILLGACVRGRHKEMAVAVFERMSCTDLVASNAMLAFLADLGALDEARNIMQSMREKNTLSWNILIQVYLRKGMSKEALEVYGVMDLEACQPRRQTYQWIVAACTRRLDLVQGRLVHLDIIELELIRAVSLATALIEMYGRCGELDQAKRIFDSIPCRSLSCWNSMLAAYAHHGAGAEALELFRIMGLQGCSPNTDSFITLFSACSHCGLISAAWEYFSGIVSSDYSPVVDEFLCMEHYLCLLDVLGRAGMVDQVEDLMTVMPVKPNRVAWTTFLGACNALGDNSRGALAASELALLEPSSASPYVMLSNLHKISL